MDNWCSTACGAGVSGRYFDLCPLYSRARFGDTEPVARVSVNLELAIYVVWLYLAVHLIEGYILVPLVQRRVWHLPPTLTLSAQIVLSVLAGFLGLLLATPLVAATLFIIRMSMSKTCSVIAQLPNPPPFTGPAP